MAKPTPVMCKDPEIFTDFDCSECDYLERRVKKLETCCDEATTKLNDHETRITNNTNKIETKQDRLIAGDSITINGNTISADLSDYYNKAEVEDLLENIETLHLIVVDELPENPDEKGIYLVPKDGENPDVYDEYVYVNNQWEKIGDTEIDLSNYVTTDELNNALSNKADKSELNSKQDKLVAGDNITIEGNTISATGGGALTKQAILDALGYCETTITMTDTDGNVVERNVLVQCEE